MPTYISLLNYNSEGIKNLKGAPERLEGVKQVISSAGGELISYHLTMGQYDAVVVSKGPDDVTMTKILLNAAIKGGFSSQTLRAFDMDEFKDIVSALP